MLAALFLAGAQEPARDLAAEVRATLTGAFLGVERHPRGEGRGHIVADERFGRYVARDYWSIAEEKVVYAGHDVLEIAPGGAARHWWFGSRGDRAEASGTWTRERVILIVRDDAGRARRRYTYDLEPGDGLAFHFRNEHASSRGWEPYMDSSWRRGEPDPIPAFVVPAQAPAGLAASYVGTLGGASGEHVGRYLFEEWIVFDTAREHGVLRPGRGQVELWQWTSSGTPRLWRGKRDGDVILFQSPGARRRDTLLPDGYRTVEEGLGAPSGCACREFSRTRPCRG